MGRPNRFDLPDLGLGVGLRTQHYDAALEGEPRVGFLELISENFMGAGGRPLRVLDQLAERYPLVLHGVALSIGSCDPLDREYLRALKALAARSRAVWLGDHVCWTGVSGRETHELLPLPHTEEVLRHLVGRVREVQDFLERPLVLENPSAYAAFRESTLSEPELLARLCDEADCALLLDVNNVLVTCRNLGLDPLAYLEAVPWERVVQVHVAGHTDRGTHLIDTHVGPVPDSVWELYAHAVRLGGPRATLLEWDTEVPSFERAVAEVRLAERHREPTCAEAAV